MKKHLLHGMIVSVLAVASAGISTPVLADTASLDLTVDANITSGTCSAVVMDGDTETTSISLGTDIALSEVSQKSRIKPFKVHFSNCAGVKTANLTVSKRSGSCTSGDPNAFRNNGGNSAGIGLEIWTTTVPEGSSSTQLICSTPNEQTITVSSTNLDYDMSARLIDVAGGNMTAGTFTSPTTFTISYQ